MIRKIKRFLRNWKLTAALYARLYALKNKKQKQEKLKYMKENGEKTILALQEILEGKCLFFFDMGTLLGIVREGKLLGHDLDIDIAVYAQDASQCEEIYQHLVAHGCRLKYRYLIDEIGIIEESYELNNIKFDINYYQKENGQDVCYLMYRDPAKEYEGDTMSVVKLFCDPIEHVEKCPFAGGMISVPEKAEDYLSQRYGASWRVPDKGWVYWKGPSTRPTSFIGYQEKR